MATWAEQNAPEVHDPIPPCAFIVRRGQEPDFARRSNILPWNEALANQPTKWRQLTDKDGAPLKELPTVGTSVIPPTEAKAPHITERELLEKQQSAAKADMQEIQVFEVFRALDPETDFKPNGMPKVDVVRDRTGLDLTGTQIKDYWRAFQDSGG